MPDLALPVIVAIACFAVHVVVNWVVSPGPLQQSPQRVAIRVTMLTAAVCIVLSTRWIGISGLPFAAVVSTSIAYCYFHLFNMSETARRIRILTSCHLGTPIDERSYSLDVMIDARIERLIMVDALRNNAGCYRSVPGPLLAAASVLEWWRHILFPVRPVGRGPMCGLNSGGQ